MSPSDAASGMSERWRKVRYDSGFAYRAQARKRWQVAGFTRRERPLPGRLTRRIPPLLSNAGTCILPRLMHALWFMLTALAVLVVAYRYYSAFITAKVLSLDATRVTPAHTLRDGNNFHPTNRWVLFGHHFAAITGAGPLIGPVLAAQFGFLPGYLWILFGVVFGGAVHDFVILVSSVRRRGRSLAQIAREELGPGLGMVTGLAILFIVVIALAGLGKVVVGALAESAWGVFTIGLSVPIALGMGLYIYKVRGGSVRGIREATVVGVVLLMTALVLGKPIEDGPSARICGSRRRR